MSDGTYNTSERMDIKTMRHKAEIPLHIVSVVFSLTVYGVLTYLATRALKDKDVAEKVSKLVEDEEGILEPLLEFGVFFIIVALIVIIIIVILRGIKNYGETLACDIPVSQRQSQELTDICSLYSKRLGIKRIPELYVTYEGENSIEVSGVAFKSEKYIRLSSDYVPDAVEKDDSTVLEFAIAKELANIALGHRNILWILLTVPARVLPFYKHIYMRTMNYSADRIAAAFVGNKEAAEAIMVLAGDPFCLDVIDKEVYLADMTAAIPVGSGAFQRGYYNLISDESIIAYRISALLDPEKKSGRLF